MKAPRRRDSGVNGLRSAAIVVLRLDSLGSTSTVSALELTLPRTVLTAQCTRTALPFGHSRCHAPCMHGGMIATAATLLALTAACSASHPTRHAETKGHLQLRLGPGAPGGASPNEIRLVISGPTRMTVHARIGQQVSLLLPQGVYSMKSTDGGACATGISVDAGATVSDDLVYPLNGCQHLG